MYTEKLSFYPSPLYLILSHFFFSTLHKFHPNLYRGHANPSHIVSFTICAAQSTHRGFFFLKSNCSYNSHVISDTVPVYGGCLIKAAIILVLFELEKASSSLAFEIGIAGVILDTILFHIITSHTQHNVWHAAEVQSTFTEGMNE